jgi:hypothetical protein
MTGDGQVRLLGNSSVNGGGSIRTSGYVYGNFRLETEIEFTVVDWISSDELKDTRTTVDSEIYFDLRLREGSKGYSISFFPASANPDANHIILRRTNDWTQIGTANVLVPDGILSGDVFHVSVIADGSDLDITITKNDDMNPLVNWSVVDDEQNVGWIRLMTYNMNEARVNYVRLGGPQWDGESGTILSRWTIY